MKVKIGSNQSKQVRVGQWVRLSNGIIEYVDYLWRDINSHYYLAYKATIDKVADDPRELIKDGDLVFIKSYWEEPLIVSYVDNYGNPRANVRTSSGSESIDLTRKFIIKILTPNSNGGYDLQYSKEGEDNE